MRTLLRVVAAVCALALAVPAEAGSKPHGGGKPSGGGFHFKSSNKNYNHNYNKNSNKNYNHNTAYGGNGGNAIVSIKGGGFGEAFGGSFGSGLGNAVGCAIAGGCGSGGDGGVVVRTNVNVTINNGPVQPAGYVPPYKPDVIVTDPNRPMGAPARTTPCPDGTARTKNCYTD